MMHPCAPLQCLTVLQPCDALRHSQPPCEAYNNTDAYGPPMTPPKQSKGARRQQRLKRTMLKSMGLYDDPAARLAPPPGLSNAQEFGSEDECQQLCTSSTDTVELARRVQRLETLLFRLRDPDFVKLDAQLTKLLEESYVDSDSALDDTSSEKMFPLNCEVFDMSLDSQESKGEVANQSCQTELLNADAKIITLDAELICLQARVGEFEERMSCISHEIVTPITAIVNDRVAKSHQLFETHEAVIKSISTEVERHEGKIDRALDLIETAMAHMHSATDIGKQQRLKASKRR